MESVCVARAVRRTGRRKLICSAGLAALSVSFAAQAQIAPSVPTREEIQRPTLPPASPPGEQVVTADDGIERAPCPLANPEFANVRVTVRNVRFSEVEGIDTSILDASWQDKVGQDQPVSVVCDIRDRAATILRAKGYLAAVRVPPQTISDGVVKLDILSARLTRVEVRGDAGANEGLLQRYLSRLDDQPVFNIVDAERYLLLARDIPGMDARLTLRPGAVPGEVVGEVTVTRTPILIDGSTQNYGSRDVGRWGSINRARFTGLTGMGDMTTVSFYSTPDFDEQKVLQLAHEFRVGGEGLRFGASYTYAWTRPDITGFNIRSNTQIVSLFASYPLVLTQARRITLGGGLDIIDQDIKLGSTPLNRDRIRVFNLRADGIWIDPASVAGKRGYSPSEPHWSLGASVEARQGVNFLGASNDCGPGGAACFLPGTVPLTRIEAKPDAFLVRANAQAEWRPTRLFTLSLAPRAQWASDPLVAYEEFSGGNFTVGRGFDPGTIIGDKGVAVSAEARYGSFVPANRKAFAFQPFAFFDAAWVWNTDSAFNGLNPQKLYSAGGGMRVAWGDRARLDVALAVPLNRGGFLTERPDPRLLISFTSQFGVKAR
ncbi:hemin transporter [Sphingopyxis sp. H071]|nr:hemin transporter [Sphingopyxis sp. H057]KTE49923.1 hemin transporter [Sphingopyxis sp. H071]KTE51181.1 hemin transporter [Sphingopyxis sp. H073]KTE56433.1 hemin transporter [Sphingopyxis sp. H107]KTE59103.1 hemin transporter [Sphingopyxis sp. H100]KTE66757.1 hemin transporter [Sphingopyxis sp. H081]KTE76212.1 hemin transporter [Sphingopyxis sp. H067]